MYDKYEKKVIKRAKVKWGLYRFRVLIFSSLAIILTSSSTIVATKGLISDKLTLANKYTYGEKLTFHSTAFLSQAEYEFSDYDKDNWQPEAPRFVGKYKMRSRGSNSFESYYYGSEQIFEITPKRIYVTPFESELTYGSKPTININDQLEYGDKLLNTYEFSYADIETATWKINVNTASLSILNFDNNDVTSCYAFEETPKYVRIIPREISFLSSSATKVYDNTALENDNFIINRGSLVEGDKITVTNTTTLINSGHISNTQSYLITNETDDDMTRHYNIKEDKGVLTITKQPISFRSITQTFVYDGMAKGITTANLSMSSAPETLVAGHEVIYKVTSEPQVKSGTYINSFSVSIRDGEVDVSENYAISYEFGKTIIEKRPITVKSGSTEKTYNKKPVTVKTYSITNGSLAEKDEIRNVTAPTFIDSGTYQNSQTFTINDQITNEDFTASYVVTQEDGEVIINKIELPVAIVQKVVTYDGKAHTNEVNYEKTTLAEQDNLIITSNIEEVNVGEYNNEVLTIDVVDEEGVTNIHNYTVTLTGQNNALIINKRPLEVTYNDQSKLYDSKPFLETLKKDTTLFEITSGTLAEGEEITFEPLTNPTNSGSYEVTGTLKITRLNGDETIETTANYEIDIIDAVYTIDQRDLIITTLDTTHIYNRNTTIPENTPLYSLGGDGLVSGHTLTGLKITFDGINVGIYNYHINSDDLIIKDSAANDVTANYNLIFVNSGTRTILPRDVTIQMTNASKVYDGTPFSSNKYSADNLLTGDWVSFFNLSEVTYVTEGKIINPAETSTHKIFTSDNREVTENYNISIKKGTIHIDPRPITLTSESVTKVFDGNFVGETSVEVSEGSLAPGDILTILSVRSTTVKHRHERGSNSFEYQITNQKGEDMADNYEITLVYGELEILPCPLEIGVYERTFIYDGLDHSIWWHSNELKEPSGPFYLISGTIPENYEVFAYGTANVEQREARIYFYDYNDGHTSYWINHLLGEDVYYDDFAITLPTEMTIIRQRPLTFSSASGSKEYDGKMFDQTVTISNGSLVEGHRVEIEYVEGLVEVGRDLINPIGKITIYEGDRDVTHCYNLTYVYGRVTIYEKF